MRTALEFSVNSSSGDGVYALRAYRTNTGIRFSCNCAAGESGTHCKHRLSLIAGDISQLASGNSDDVIALADLVRGSPLAASISELASLEAEADRLKKSIGTVKRSIAKLMMG